MKILILASDIGKTAPGIVFERLISGLSLHHEIVVITSSFESHQLHENSSLKIYQIKKLNIHPRLHKLFLTSINLDLSDFIWSYMVENKLRKTQTIDFDIIFSLVSFRGYAGLIAGQSISKKWKCKHAAYLVDALPAPIEWLKSQSYHRGLTKFVKKYLSNVDFLFSANPQMLKYQLNILNLSNNIAADVIYVPSFKKKKHYKNSHFNTNYFIYTGGIYGPRVADYVINGFLKLLKDYPDSKLIFVGTVLSENTLSSLGIKDNANIELHPFSNDLDNYYEMATALIDIDSTIENDIFLSSKIANYINTDRIIISETGQNSPSRLLFQNLKSVIQCNHDSNELYLAMKHSISVKNEINFHERDEVRSLFQIENIIGKISNNLEKALQS